MVRYQKTNTNTMKSLMYQIPNLIKLVISTILILLEIYSLTPLVIILLIHMLIL